jgi:predicted permease
MPEWKPEIRARLAGLSWEPAREAGIVEEISQHLEDRFAELRARGVSEEEARRTALEELSSENILARELRRVETPPNQDPVVIGATKGNLVEEFFADLKYGARMLCQNPGFTAVAVLTLALGIGASTAVFSLVNAILLRSLPVPRPQELRVLRWSGGETRIPSYEGASTIEGNRWTDADCVTHPAFLNLREASARMADVFGFCPIQEAIVRLAGGTFMADGSMVSDNFFSGLGVQPLIGRLLQKGEDYSSGMNVVISYNWWEKHFGSDVQVLGRPVTLNGTIFTIIGVLPRGFAGAQPGSPCEFYAPMAPQSPFLYKPPITGTFHWFVRLMARLRPGFNDAQLSSALNVAFATEVAPVMKDPRIQVQPGFGGLSYTRDNYRKLLWSMLGVVGLVMMVACANVAGLLLVRGVSRQHELAVRAALGARRWRLIRQSLTEIVLLTFWGGGFGVLLAVWGRAAIARLLVNSAEGLYYDLSLDLTVLGFSLAVALLTALLSGLLPAWRAGCVDPASGFRSRGVVGTPRLGTGRVLVAAQICLSLLLLTGAGLYSRTLINLTHIDAGFQVERLLLVGLNTKLGRDGGPHPAEFYGRLENSLDRLPGVKSATLLGFPLLADMRWTGGFEMPGHVLDSQAQTCRLPVSETFFPTMGIPILQGRGFEAGDTGKAPKVVVVNESFARKYLPDENPIGLNLSMFGADWRIVGVCRDSKYDNLKALAQPTTYFPYRQEMILSPSLSNNLSRVCFAVRTTIPPMALAPSVRQAVGQLDPGVAITTLTTQAALRDQGLSQERLLATLCGLLALLTVLLSCLGLYGLMAYNVTRRTSEIAIRLALGAPTGSVARSILREALALAAIGIAFGLPAIFALTRFLKSQLYGVQPNDLITLGGAITALVAVALLAAWLPAHRAAKVDATLALRHE